MGQPDLHVARVDLNKQIEKPPKLMEPTPPVLGKNISSFPLGFKRLALADHMSPNMVHYLGRLFKWFRNLSKAESPLAAPKYDAEHSPNASMTEKVLAIGLQAFLDYLQGVKPHTADEAFDLPLQ
jgi:hypothetical protein